VSNELAHTLRQTVLHLARRVRAERADASMSDGKLSVLFVLMNEGAQTLGSLSEHERVTPPSMNRTVNALVEAGLVTRDSSPEDGRKVLIQLTNAGLEVAQETKRRRVAWLARRLDTLTPAQLEILDAAAPILREIADS